MKTSNLIPVKYKAKMLNLVPINNSDLKVIIITNNYNLFCKISSLSGRIIGGVIAGITILLMIQYSKQSSLLAMIVSNQLLNLLSPFGNMENTL